MAKKAKTTKDDAPEHILWVIEKKLSDGSSVYNVEFEGTEFPCIDLEHAGDLAETIAEAINEHTNTTAGVMY